LSLFCYNNVYICDDCKLFPQEHERVAGRLILLDGATGKSIGRYLAMPGGLETYMSPVLHVLNDGAAYVLFGLGGETVPGSVHSISQYRFAVNNVDNAMIL